MDALLLIVPLVLMQAISATALRHDGDALESSR